MTFEEEVEKTTTTMSASLSDNIRWQEAFDAGFRSGAHCTKQEMGWRPIESAPRDKTEILISSKKGNVFVGRWDLADRRPYTLPSWCKKEPFVPLEESWLSCWMPIPEPPTEAGE